MDEKLKTYISAVKKQKKYLNKFRDNSLLYSTDIMGIDYNLADIEDIIYDYNYSIKVNKTPLYSPELADEELKALLSYRKGEYFTDEEIYNYMNELINGGIHIKKKNRGKFTKSAKAAGQSVQEHAHSVMNNPKASTLQRRRANFAIQAKKWAKKRKKK